MILSTYNITFCLLHLGHIDSGDSAAAISLKSQIKELERTIEEKDAAYNKLQQTCDSNKEQVNGLFNVCEITNV